MEARTGDWSSFRESVDKVSRPLRGTWESKSSWLALRLLVLAVGVGEGVSQNPEVGPGVRLGWGGAGLNGSGVQEGALGWRPHCRVVSVETVWEPARLGGGKPSREGRQEWPWTQECADAETRPPGRTPVPGPAWSPAGGRRKGAPVQVNTSLVAPAQREPKGLALSPNPGLLSQGCCAGGGALCALLSTCCLPGLVSLQTAPCATCPSPAIEHQLYSDACPALH